MNQEQSESCDPLCDRLHRIAVELLKTKSEITINDLIDVMECRDSTIRPRLNLLVRLNKLKSVKGIGRRPNYYFLPDDSMDRIPSSEFAVRTLERLFDLKEKEEEELLTRLSLVRKAKNALSNSIEILTNLNKAIA